MTTENSPEAPEPASASTLRQNVIRFTKAYLYLHDRMSIEADAWATFGQAFNDANPEQSGDPTSIGQRCLRRAELVRACIAEAGEISMGRLA